MLLLQETEAVSIHSHPAHSLTHIKRDEVILLMAFFRAKGIPFPLKKKGLQEVCFYLRSRRSSWCLT